MWPSLLQFKVYFYPMAKTLISIKNIATLLAMQAAAAAAAAAAGSR